MKAALGTTVTYASQGWIIAEEKMILTIGSYGQVGFSNLESGISIVFMQDWEDNGVGSKMVENVAIARKVIKQLSKK